MSKFYDFKITKESYQRTQRLAVKMGARHFVQAAIFGFALETVFLKWNVCKLNR